MRLVYALILCAGFNLDWKWYVLSIAMWLFTVTLGKGVDIADMINVLVNGRRASIHHKE